MTATTNGASLEDCLTNIFSLIDLNGLRWKRFKHKDNNNAFLHAPIDTHPILTTYAKCIKENHIAVWRHEPQKRYSSSSTGGHGGHSGGIGTELWIFGYGDQLRVDNVIGDDLIEIEDDTWDSKGLSYECRTLLFKALHNLIERCLIAKGFTKIGRWFVQPLADGLRHTSTRSSSSYFTTSLDGSKSSLSFAFSFFVHGDTTVCATVDVRQHPLVHPLTKSDLTTFQEGGIVRVALAPFGLNGILNGVSYKDCDNGAATTTFIQQWSKFYPLSKTSSPEVPPVVEVIVAGHRMRYPSECVFTTSKVVDLYKSLSSPSSSRSATSLVNKRPNKSNLSKTNKMSLLGEKLNEDKSDQQTALKAETEQTKAQGPTDLVKLFPTPPSFEQIILTPSNLTEEAGAKEMSATTTQSPPNMNQAESDFNKNNEINVYKPLECAIMSQPSKWAALNNITVTKSLPPECIYKGSSNGNGCKNVVSRLTESTKGNLSKYSGSTKQFGSLLSNSPQSPSPLTDQTNKNGFNSLNLNTSSPKPSTNITNLLTGSTNNCTPLINTNAGLMDSFSSTTYSLFTLPHQRLFNNLYEINPIQLNLLISDSALGMFKDHNFESCALCVCNMSIKGTSFDSISQRSDSNIPWRPSIGGDSMLNSSTPYSGEFVNECTCGFSAVTNRHCSHLSGLFLEDELELTNVLYDPTEMIDQHKLFRKIRLSTYSESAYNDENLLVEMMNESNAIKASKSPEDNSKLIITKHTSRLDKSSHSSQNLFEETKIFVIDQLKQQCSSMIHTNSSLSKVLLIESFRNNRHLTSCSNYYAQTSISKLNMNSPFHKLLDENQKYTIVKMMNRNPMSLKFSDFCELAKSIVVKLGNQNPPGNRLASSLMKPLGSGIGASNGLISKMFNPSRQSIMSKTGSSNNRNNVFIQGLQALVTPTLSIDPKGALQMLEHLVKEESKEALATLNKAILIFSSPIHDWQFLTTPIPENNFDVANLLKIIQPSLDESIGSHNKLYKDFVHQQQQAAFSSRDSPTGEPTLPTPPCQGPLTWRQFHQAAGRGTEDQCEPQPIPSLLLTHHVEKNHLALSPFALKFWDKLLLEPYAPGHNMFYLVVAPESQNILGHVNAFFKELGNTYELMKLGKHAPIGNGLVLANFTSLNATSDQDDWFSKLDLQDTCNILPKLRSYASKLNAGLAKTIIDFMEERQPPYDPRADRFESSPNPHRTKTTYPTVSRVGQQQSSNRPFNHFGGGSDNPAMVQSDAFGSVSEGQAQSEYVSQLSKSQTLISSSHANNDENIHLEEEANRQSGIVIYIIDPFSSPSITQNLRALSTIGLFKCYSMLLDHLPENLKRITQLQLISLDSIISHSRPILNISRVDQLKSLSMNIYSRCKKILTSQITAKSLTGFGPAAALEAFFKTKNAELCTTKMFTPPYILAPMKDKQTELGEMFGDRREKSSVLFCSYCITEDQRWLIASVTNDKGEISETTVININIIDRMKRPKSSVKRIALRKLMEFIISVMSDWMNPWRLVIGKLGRVGHGELKEWASLMGKRSLLNYSRHLAERCRQCCLLPSTETVSILSACLVSLEPDSKLRIMPDQFTSDDRQASFNKCPLSTPEDASATHILVFPTSASIQSSHGNVEDLGGSGIDEDLCPFPLEDGMDDLGVGENMDDLFVWDDNPANPSDNISSHHDTLMSSSNLQLGSGSVSDNTNNQDETLQLLQQPLALGYYISTAKIGQMPNWFWSTSPHLRNSCPVFLKSALHIHMPCVQLSDDLLHSGVCQSRKSHQLDSNLTTDVLRYVLEGYNSLSWLALNPKTYDRQSCLPVHIQNLLQLYHLMESFS